MHKGLICTRRPFAHHAQLHVVKSFQWLFLWIFCQKGKMLWVKTKAHVMYHKKQNKGNCIWGYCYRFFPFKFVLWGISLLVRNPCWPIASSKNGTTTPSKITGSTLDKKTPANFHPKFKTSSGENVIFISGFCCTPACPFFVPNGGYNVGFFPAWDPSVQEAFLRFFSKVKPK